MKKILVAALLILCLGVSACGNEKASASNENVEVQPEETEESGKKEKQNEQKPEKAADKDSSSEKKTPEKKEADSNDATEDQKAAPSKAQDNQNTGNGGEKNTSSHAGSTDSKKPSGGGSNGSTDSQKPSGGNTGSTDTQKPSGGGNGGSTARPEAPAQPEQPSKPQEPEHIHSWVEETTTVTHEATGHYEEKVIKEAWEEPVYEYRLICNKCGTDVTNDEERAIHYAFECGGGWSDKKVQTGTIHHEAETEQVWVEDSPAYTETVGTGKYTCSTCGAKK